MKKLLLFFMVISYQMLSAQIDATSVMVLPVLTNAEMNSVITPNQGSIIYNSTDDLIYKHDGTNWLPLQSVISTVEELKIIRGNVNANGTIAQGSGFTVTALTNARYQIDFTVPFSTIPSVTFTTGEPTALAGNTYEDNTANIIFISNSRVVIVTMDAPNENGRETSWFSFIAVGPR
ncbi:hypothetical protein [Aquimarina sediminis]|uniref:hypothetical protein n=1 Tax=Aquimarina sediminis TaxID=2070536 RepID=UPI000CA04F35|nr:hypothetical protein [Aquimarina sediminis]